MDTDEPTPTPTVLSRLVSGGMTEQRVLEHFAAGRLHVDGELVEDVDQPAPPPARIVITAS